MAEKSSFFNAIISNGIPDRTYKAEEFAKYFGSFIGNGVFPNPSTGLQVVSIDNNMTVRVKLGKAWINGYYYENTDDLILSIDNADGVLKRIDRVVVRLDYVNREITCKIKKGTFASSPVVPVLQRDANIYELGIADILVENGVIAIQQSKITDTRLNNELCGIVTQTVNTIDTTTLYNQLKSDIEEKGLKMNEWITGAKEFFTNDFNTWFDGIKGALDGDVAGNLLNRIIELENKVGNGLTADNILMADGSSVETSILEIKQSVSSGKAKVATAITGKGVPTGSDASFDTMASNIGLIKVAKGNAIETDVLSGKTFTNADGVVRTGNIVNRGNVGIIVPGTTRKNYSSGYYSANFSVEGDADLIAANIRKGKNIFGINGTLVEGVPGGKKYASGTQAQSNYYVEVRGLSFKPRKVTVRTSDTSGGLPKRVIIYDAKITTANAMVIEPSFSYTQDFQIYNDGFKMPFITDGTHQWEAYE